MRKPKDNTNKQCDCSQKKRRICERKSLDKLETKMRVKLIALIGNINNLLSLDFIANNQNRWIVIRKFT